MPMSKEFKDRLYPYLLQIVKEFGTPFHIYDALGIEETGRSFKKLFLKAPAGFKQFFAVKALPNLEIMKMMLKMGFGFDCSAIPELEMALMAGAKPEDIMFSSNNTSDLEMVAALKTGCILNLDDISFIKRVTKMPELICFRYNPGAERTGNSIIGNPEESKYGLRRDQIVKAYKMAKERGAKRFGIHTMICSNQLDYKYIVETVHMLLAIVKEIQAELGIKFEFINIGGGIGIPYRPEQKQFNVKALARESIKALNEFKKVYGYAPKLYTECGRYITGPHGVLVTKVINRMEKYKPFIGVDACMSSLMRPAMYDAYHHIQIHNGGRKKEVINVVGSLCENNDWFAKDRKLPLSKIGDIMIIHDTGAHGIAMAFQYNARLRPAELLLDDKWVKLIRRAETTEDYLRTQRDFKPKTISSRRK